MNDIARVVGAKLRACEWDATLAQHPDCGIGGTLAFGRGSSQPPLTFTLADSRRDSLSSSLFQLFFGPEKTLGIHKICG